MGLGGERTDPEEGEVISFMFDVFLNHIDVSFLFAIQINSNVFICQFKFQVIAPGELLSLQSRKPSVYNQVHLGGHLSI